METRVVVKSRGITPVIAPATLLGQNLEMAGDTETGLLSDRLANPRFRGPAHPLTGIAGGWQPAQSNNYPGIRFELTRGMSLSGEESQLLHNFSGRQGLGILQTGLWTREGEKLELSLWARAQHHPVTLRLGLRPLEARAAYYSQATIGVNATYWKEYHAQLLAPRADRDAVFFCYLEGEGMVWLDQVHLRPAGMGLLRQDLLERVRTLAIPVLRFPGGCISTNYHWRLGTGSQALRPSLLDPVFKWHMGYDVGTDEYLSLCLDMGIQPHITVNIGSGTPDEAGAWAAYCTAWYRRVGVEPPVMYWQMGNEHYGAWELGNMTGDLYVQALREFVPAIRRAYPRSRIIALGPVDGEILPDQRLPWRKPVLEQAGDLVDLIALQAYAGGWAEDKTQQYQNALGEAQRIADMLQVAIDDGGRRTREVRVALTEWNLWHQASHYDERGFLEPYDVEHGLFVASMLHHFVRLAPGLELANFYHLVNPMGIFISRGPEVEETVLADIFRLYRPAFPGQVLALETDSPYLRAHVPAVDAICLLGETAGWLFLINRFPDTEVVVCCEGLPALAEGIILAGEALGGRFAHQALPQHEGGLKLSPLSIASVRLSAEG